MCTFLDRLCAVEAIRHYSLLPMSYKATVLRKCRLGGGGGCVAASAEGPT